MHGTDGIDELTTTGESVVARIEESEPGGAPTIKAARITPEMAGLPRATLDQFTGGDVQRNKRLTSTTSSPASPVLAATSCF